MSISLELRLKDGSYQAIELGDEDAGRLSQAFEDEEGIAPFGDLGLTLDNTDGYWSGLFTDANLVPTDAYPHCYGFRLSQDGTPFFEGDLDYSSVEHHADESTTEVRVMGGLARLARHNAEVLKRDYSGIQIVSGYKKTKVLTVNSVLDAGGDPLEPDDEITLAHVKHNGKWGKQTLKVYSVDQGNNTITFTRKLQWNYSAAGDLIIVNDPWKRNKTAAWLIEALANLVPGFDSPAARIIDYDDVTWSDIVDVADFSDLDVGGAIQKLADWVNATVDCKLNVLRVIGREKQATTDPPKPIDDLIGEGSLQPAGYLRYDRVVIKGRNDRFVSKGVSTYQGEELTKEFKFSKDRARLQAVAGRYWDYWGRIRGSYEELPVADDGTAYELGGRVSIGGVNYKIVGAGSDLADNGARDLNLAAETGVLVDPGSYDQDDVTDDEDDPPEPTGVVFTKDYSDMFKALYPWQSYPRIRRVVELDADGNVISEKKKRLYEIRWAYPYDEVGALVWRFQLTVWHDGSDRDKPKRVFTAEAAQQSDGLYYSWTRLPAGQVWWVDVVAILTDLRESPPSDPNNSTAEDDSVAPEWAPPGAATLNGLASTVQDIPGSRRVECDLTAAFTLAAPCTGLVVETKEYDGATLVNYGTETVSSGPGNINYYKKKAGYQGNTVYLRWKAVNGTAEGAWSTADGAGAWGDDPPTTPASDMVACGGALPAVPAISGISVNLAIRTFAVFQVLWSPAAANAYRSLHCEISEDNGATWEPLPTAEIWQQRATGSARYVVNSFLSYQQPLVRFYVEDIFGQKSAYSPDASGTDSTWWSSNMPGGPADEDRGTGGSIWQNEGASGISFADNFVQFSGSGWQGRMSTPLHKQRIAVNADLQLSAFGSAWLGIAGGDSSPANGYAVRLTSTTQLDLYLVTAGSPGASPIGTLMLDHALPTAESFPLRLEIHKSRVVLNVGQYGDRLSVSDDTHRVEGWSPFLGSVLGSWGETASTMTVKAVSADNAGRLWDGASAGDLLSTLERDSDGYLNCGSMKLAVDDAGTEYARILQAGAALMPVADGNNGGTPTLTNKPILKGNMIIGAATGLAGMPAPSADLIGTPFLYGSGFTRRLYIYAWDTQSSSFQLWYAAMQGETTTPSGDPPPSGGDNLGGSCFLGDMELDGESGIYLYKDLQRGDRILAPHPTTGEDVLGQVLSVKAHEVESCLLIDDWCGVTPEHLLFLWAPGQMDMTMSAGGCKPGTRLWGKTGAYMVQTVQLYKPGKKFLVYSATIDLGRYWVGKTVNGQKLRFAAHNLKDLGL